MWNWLKGLVDFDTFFMGCGVYYEMLVAVGLAPASQGSFPNVDVAPEPWMSSADMAGIDTLTHPGMATHLDVSIAPIDQWAVRG